MSDKMFNPQDLLKTVTAVDKHLTAAQAKISGNYTANLAGVDFNSNRAQNNAADYFAKTHLSMLSGNNNIFKNHK